MNLHPRHPFSVFRFLDMWNSNPNTCFTGISSTYFLLFMSSVVLEVVLYWENTDAQPADSKESTIKGLFYQLKHHSFVGITLHNAY